MFNGLKLASPVSSGLRLGQPSPLRRLARVALGIAPREISFSRRGFNCDSEDVRHHLEGIAACFVRGYHTALETDLDGIGPLLDREVPELRGFAYEGAGMGLALLDTLTPWRRDRLHGFSPERVRPHLHRPCRRGLDSRPPASVPRAPAGALRRPCCAGWLSTATASTRASSTRRRIRGRRRSRPRSRGYARRALRPGARPQPLVRRRSRAANASTPGSRPFRPSAGATCGAASASPAPTPAGLTARSCRQMLRLAGERRAARRRDRLRRRVAAAGRRLPDADRARLPDLLRGASTPWRRLREAGAALPPDGAEAGLRGLAPAHPATISTNERRRDEQTHSGSSSNSSADRLLGWRR